MNEVARSAGVGAATLYRHFSTREDLAEAVYRSKLDELTARVVLRTQAENGQEALRVWVEEFANFMLATRGMMDTLRSSWTSGTMSASPTTTHIAEVIARFLERGQHDSSLRGEIDPRDVIIAILGLLGADADETRIHRMLGMFLDGLHTHRP